MTLAPIPLISTPEEIDDAWLSKVFRASGFLDQSQSVVFHHKQSLGDAAGLLGILYRVNPEYSDGAEGPTSAVIKFPTTDPAQRGICDVLGFYKREITFYNEHTDGLPFGTPKCYGAVQDSETTDFVLVMEDIAYLDQIDQVAGASLDQARSAVRQIAGLHAKWWQHADLESMKEVFRPLLNPIHLAALPDIFRAGWPACVEHNADTLTPEVKAFGDRFPDLVPFLLEELNTPASLVHGDFRGDNLLFDDDGNLTVLDFQITGIANGLFDVAYFLCQSIGSDTRRGHDEELVQLYVDNLAAGGVDYPIEEAMRAYRIATAYCLIYAVTSWQAYDSFEGRQHTLMAEILSRTVQSIMDNNSLALLPAE
ncbi:MAG: phosphotransferase [Actinomycetia bacterium]|nr:phosphotransferase [Actinomycetes bacterium]MCP4957719.1 phosphotransferase [Actinomycetes bacterium]